jgi:hypothetical protein
VGTNADELFDTPVPRRLFVAIDLPKEVGWRLAQLLAEPPRGVWPVKPAPAW